MLGAVNKRTAEAGKGLPTAANFKLWVTLIPMLMRL